MIPFRIGSGFDVHAFTDGDHIVLGGVTIPFERAVLAHSDGDVLLHALCDALLGAAALGDIGKHFPDSDDRFRGVSSRRLLQEVVSQLAAVGYGIVNVDLTIIAQAPKMQPYLAQMCRNIAADCLLNEPDVNVKATTTERLGFIGREQGIACQAAVLLAQLDFIAGQPVGRV